MPNKWIFLCYRRKDSTVQAGRIFDVLNSRFPDQVFQDVESIDIGMNWTEELRESVLSADVLVVVIGPEWQSMATDRGPRIDDPADYVHMEVRTALEHDIRIIPVLLQGAQMPQPRTLPPQLEGLLRRQALPLHDAMFEGDIARLIARLERVQQEAERVSAQAGLQSTARMPQELAARKLAAYAESIAVKPRGLPRAGLLALESMLRFPLPNAHGVLRQVRAGLPRCDGQLAHPSKVTSVAESSKGQWISTGSADGVVKVWDTATLTLAIEFRTGGEVGALAFDSEERWLAAATGDSKLHAWELPAGRSLAVLDTPQPLIKLLVQSDSEATSLIGLSREFSNGHLMVWDSRDWRLLWSRGKITDVAGQAQQQVIAVGLGDHVVLAHTVSGQMLENFPVQATVTGVAWHQSFQLFTASTLEGALWRGFVAASQEGKLEWQCERLEGYVSPVAPMAFSPKTAWLAVADGNGLSVLNLEDLSRLSLPLKGRFGIDFTFSRQGSFLAALSPESHSITVWRLPAGRPVMDLEFEAARVVRFGTKENRMISASHENAARVWELPTGEAALWGRDLGLTESFAFSPRGDMVTWTGREVAPNGKVQLNHSNLLVMRTADGEIAFSTVHEGMIDAVAFDVDSNWVALRSGEAVRVFDLRRGEESPALAAKAEAWFPGLAIPDGPLPELLSERETLQSLWSVNHKWLVTRHPGRIRVWDGTTESELTGFPIATDTTGMVISPDETYLAIGGRDGDLQIRSLPDGTEIAVFPHDGAVTKFAFSPDGNFVIASGVDAAAVLMWIVSPDILIEDVRRRLDRDLTREEWELYVGIEPYSETRSAASIRLRTSRTPKTATDGLPRLAGSASRAP